MKTQSLVQHKHGHINQNKKKNHNTVNKQIAQKSTNEITTLFLCCLKKKLHVNAYNLSHISNRTAKKQKKKIFATSSTARCNVLLSRFSVMIVCG